MNQVDIFTQAESANIVGVGVVGDGGVQMETRIKGGATGFVAIENWQGDPQRWSSCVPRMVEGRRAAVFLDGDRRFVAHYQSALTMTQRSESRATLTDALRQFLATEGEERRAHLVAVAAGEDELLGNEAAAYLVDQVAWLEDYTREERDALRERLESRERYSHALGWLLVRLYDWDTVEILERQLASSPSESADRLGLTLLQRPLCPLSPPIEYIASIRRAEPRTRVAALDRCERKAGVSLYPFAQYLSGTLADHVWRNLADSCEELLLSGGQSSDPGQ